MKIARKTWVKPRHQVVHDLICYPAKLLFFLLYGLKTEPYPIKRRSPPCLILGNHTTPLDSVCLGTSFDFPIYYVASDHIFRLGWASRLLKYLVEPIPIMKSRFDLRTIKDMMTVVGQGGSVSLFPEGNRNYSGESIGFSPSVANLAKKLGIPLLLYRFEGGYFTAPRWADTIRRGRMTGRVVRTVSVEEMAGMTTDELFLLIKSELYENAYDRQALHPVPFRGRRLAESLERALYLCPACRGMATMHSLNDVLECRCGLKARYTGYGLLENAGEVPLPFQTILQWDRWQKMTLPEWLSGRLADGGGEPLLADDGQRLYACDRAGVNTLVGNGRFALYEDRFGFAGEGRSFQFPLAGIGKAVIHGKQALQFTVADGTTYEVKSDLPRSALKYLNVFELLKNSNQEVQDGFFSL